MLQHKNKLQQIGVARGGKYKSSKTQDTYTYKYTYQNEIKFTSFQSSYSFLIQRVSDTVNMFI